jgi:hypothetical protein
MRDSLFAFLQNELGCFHQNGTQNHAEQLRKNGFVGKVEIVVQIH